MNWLIWIRFAFAIVTFAIQTWQQLNGAAKQIQKSNGNGDGALHVEKAVSAVSDQLAKLISLHPGIPDSIPAPPLLPNVDKNQNWSRGGKA